jgi:hypothetical protein
MSANSNKRAKERAERERRQEASRQRRGQERQDAFLFGALSGGLAALLDLPAATQGEIRTVIERWWGLARKAGRNETWLSTTLDNMLDQMTGDPKAAAGVARIRQAIQVRGGHHDAR